jgi:flagellar motor switch/type III secretory pathway protein FliN
MAETTAAASQQTSGFSPELWEEAGWLRCVLSAELAVPRFTVRDLLQLSVGSIVETRWRNGHDVPLYANKRQIGWIEFEALGHSVAVRITELR